jgi:hypothetical protein
MRKRGSAIPSGLHSPCFSKLLPLFTQQFEMVFSRIGFKGNDFFIFA